MQKNLKTKIFMSLCSILVIQACGDTSTNQDAEPLEPSEPEVYISKYCTAPNIDEENDIYVYLDSFINADEIDYNIYPEAALPVLTATLNGIAATLDIPLDLIACPESAIQEAWCNGVTFDEVDNVYYQHETELSGNDIHMTISTATSESGPFIIFKEFSSSFPHFFTGSSTLYEQGTGQADHSWSWSRDGINSEYMEYNDLITGATASFVERKDCSGNFESNDMEGTTIELDWTTSEETIHGSFFVNTPDEPVSQGDF